MGPVDGDPDASVLSIGQASSMLGIEVGALRRLEAATGGSTGRSGGGQRRYSANQVAYFSRVNAVIAEGNTAHGAAQIIALQEEVDRLRSEIAQLRRS